MTASDRRRFGNVRRRASGRWQARYVGPDGLQRTAPHTFESEKKALKWLTVMEADIIRGTWTAPEAAETVLDDYAPRWIAERKLSSRTREAYEDLYRLYIRDHLGRLALGQIKTSTIRTWRRRLLDDGRSEPQAVKAYCLLRAVFTTAVQEDGLLPANPCRVRGFDKYTPPERPTASVAQVEALAAAIPSRYSAFVTLAAYSGLRWGELAALRRGDLDLTERTVRVTRTLIALRGRMIFGPPKSAAGRRTVALPTAAVKALRVHLAEFVPADPEALVFTGDKGALLRTGNFARAVGWRALLDRLGFPPGFHFHDLRHTGNTLSAPGASTRELMRRMGHASMRAALIYQHATDERDREIAAGIDARIARTKTKKRGKRKAEKRAKPEADTGQRQLGQSG
jgi:integrase